MATFKITLITSDPFASDAAAALRRMNAVGKPVKTLHSGTFKELCKEAGIQTQVRRHEDGVWIHLMRG